MEQDMMKHKIQLRKLKDNSYAGITVYVFILMGMSIMLYLFGFTNMYTNYQSQIDQNGSQVQQANFTTNEQFNPLNLVINLLTKNAGWVIGGIGGIIGMVLIGWFTKTDLSSFYMYIIPIGIITIFLNVIVFPIYPISNELIQYQIAGFPISIFLIIFFNLWFLLAIIEYIRSGVTA
jgi:hypothetical protein